MKKYLIFLWWILTLWQKTEEEYGAKMNFRDWWAQYLLMDLAIGSLSQWLSRQEIIRNDSINGNRWMNQEVSLPYGIQLKRDIYLISLFQILIFYLRETLVLNLERDRESVEIKIKEMRDIWEKAYFQQDNRIVNPGVSINRESPCLNSSNLSSVNKKAIKLNKK